MIEPRTNQPTIHADELDEWATDPQARTTGVPDMVNDTGSEAAITSAESLLRCLAADAEAGAYVAPRDARSAGDSDGAVEVAMRSHQGELRSGDLFQQVQALVFGDVHSVNGSLTHRVCQAEVDGIHSGRTASGEQP